MYTVKGSISRTCDSGNKSISTLRNKKRYLHVQYPRKKSTHVAGFPLKQKKEYKRNMHKKTHTPHPLRK
jgi:hypothetical protein